MRHIIFGDTGGHREPLFKALVNLGMDPYTHVLPADVTVYHLGDLIHKGPDSEGVVDLVESIRQAGGNWVQLAGNHEMQYLGGPLFWDSVVPERTQRTLHEWKHDGFLRFAAELPPTVLTTGDGTTRFNSPTFLTHAGISAPFLEAHLPGVRMSELVPALNALSVPDLAMPGDMLGGIPVNLPPAGPVWANGNSEVWKSWVLQGNMPMNQVVGHITPYSYSREQWFPGTFLGLMDSATVDRKKRTLLVPVYDRHILFNDPGFSKYATAVQPYSEFKESTP